MSTDENKKLMQKIFDRLADGDGTMFMEHLADDVVLTVTGEHSWSGIFCGKETIARKIYGYLRTLVNDTGKTKAFNFIADGDLVAIEAKGDMVTKNGTPYRNHYCLIYRLQDGKIMEMKEYMDSVMAENILGKYPEKATEAR